MNQRHTQTVLRRLKKLYPEATCSLDNRTPLQLLIATILSAQCTDVRVNQVTPSLFDRYTSAKDFADADPDELAGFIKSTGFYRNKTKAIIEACQTIVEEHDGAVPDELDALVQLPGVGRKTANVVLGNAFGKATGVVVDTHVKRLSYRLGLTEHTNPEKIEQDLMQAFPQKEWVALSHRLIYHGRETCTARKPACARCALNDCCPQHGVSA